VRRRLALRRRLCLSSTSRSSMPRAAAPHGGRDAPRSRGATGSSSRETGYPVHASPMLALRRLPRAAPLRRRGADADLRGRGTSGPLVGPIGLGWGASARGEERTRRTWRSRARTQCPQCPDQRRLGSRPPRASTT
jgi:hypothetical protein